jgi:hypothetical protein
MLEGVGRTAILHNRVACHQGIQYARGVGRCCCQSLVYQGPINLSYGNAGYILWQRRATRLLTSYGQCGEVALLKPMSSR